MNPVIQILERRALISEEAVVELAEEAPVRDLCAIRDEIQQVLESAEVPHDLDDPLYRFNFIASSSLRGDFSCIGWGCKLRKIEAMARYSALYCDRMIVPLTLWADRHNDESVARQVFRNGILSVLQMRQAIEAGVVVLVPGTLGFCPFCHPERIPGGPDLESVVETLAETDSSRFRLEAERINGRLRLRAGGPGDFFEHDVFLGVRGQPAWMPTLDTSDRERLTDAQVRQSGYITRFFRKMGLDAAIQQLYGLKYDAKYLTNLPGEAAFLRMLNKEDRVAANTASLCSRLTHSIPLLTDVPLETVLKVRAEEREAFLQYRNAITKIIRDHIRSGKAVTGREAEDIYSDILEPELLKLQAQAKQSRRSASKKAFARAAASVGIIGLGVYSGILPAQAAQLCNAVGGVGLLSSLAEAFTAIEKNPTEIRNSNMYFLLRLKQEVTSN